MAHRLAILVLTLSLLAGCQSLVNPFEPDQSVNYYGDRVSMKWLMAFKTVHCATTLTPHNGQPQGEIVCFDTQEEVFAAIGAEPPRR